MATGTIGLAREIRRVPDFHTAFGYDSTGVRRAAITRDLVTSPGRDLVIVRYGPMHVPHHEWVYNDADIDASEIVWARDMGPERNRTLIEYFHDRSVWILREGFEDGTDGLSPYADVGR